jgi:hypothetical protein
MRQTRPLIPHWDPHEMRCCIELTHYLWLQFKYTPFNSAPTPKQWDNHAFGSCGEYLLGICTEAPLDCMTMIWHFTLMSNHTTASNWCHTGNWLYYEYVCRDNKRVCSVSHNGTITHWFMLIQPIHYSMLHTYLLWVHTGQYVFHNAHKLHTVFFL